MKQYLLSGLVLISALAFGDDIKVERQVQLVHVNTVTTEIVGSGFPSTEVKVTATFGNSCEVPRPEELVKIVNYTRGFDELNISLGVESLRACPAVYMPVTVTINLGQYVRPNDGLFRRVIVNGKIAKKLN